MKKVEIALKMFNSGYNCSQAVFGTFCEDLGLDKETALKLSTGFGGGLRKGEVCGAVSGAIMVLGLKNGHHIEGDSDTKARAYMLTNNFIKKFEEINRSIVCKNILGYDISIEHEHNIAEEKGLFQNVCTTLIKDAVHILETMLVE